MSAEPQPPDSARFAVLGDGHSRRSDHEGGGGRDVEGIGAVAAGAAGVHGGNADVDAQGVVSHNLGHAGNLVRRLALDAQRREEGPDLGFGGLAGHDFLHHGSGLRGGQ